MDNTQGTTPAGPTNPQEGNYHKTLARQIRKYLGDNPELGEDMKKLLQAVSSTYTHADEDRALIERSLEISSQELTENYQRVKQQVDAKTVELQQRTEEAEDSRSTLQAILENLPLGVLVVKAPSGEPIMINRAGMAIAGNTNDPLDRSSSLFDLEAFRTVTKEDGSAYPLEELPIVKTIATGKAYVADDICLKRPDGTRVTLRTFTAPILRTDGTFNNAVSVFEDISEERNLERTKDEFFAIASHELRTPLTSIRGNASIIMNYYAEAMKDASLAEMIQDIHESSIRLISIVNDFLDMSSLEQSRMNFKFVPLNVIDVANEVIKEYESASQLRGVRLTLTPPSSSLHAAYADRDRLKQVLINLVGNALKFTAEGSVTISFASDSNKVKIVVSDTGTGMSEAAKKNLFHKFEQTGATPLTRDSVRGTGLGLYISKLLMNQMHGDVLLESSEPGKGTVFSILIPYVA